MIKIVYVGEDDYMARLKHGDILLANPSEDGNGYFFKSELGDEFYVANHEVLIY